jgi:transposase
MVYSKGMKKLYKVYLDEQTRLKLEKMHKGGLWPVRQLKRSRILILSDNIAGQLSLTDGEIATQVGCGRNTVQRVRQRFCDKGLVAALTEKPRPGQKRKLDLKAEQRLIAIACTTPPNGAERWTLSLLVQAVQNHKLTSSISDETVRQILLRHDLKP